MSTKIIDVVFALSAPQYAPAREIDAQHLNWQAVIKLADESGVFPVVFTNIAKHYTKLVPEDIMSSARSRMARWWATTWAPPPAPAPAPAR